MSFSFECCYLFCHMKNWQNSCKKTSFTPKRHSVIFIHWQSITSSPWKDVIWSSGRHHEDRFGVEGRAHAALVHCYTSARYLVVLEVRVQLIYFVHIFWVNEGTKLNPGKLDMIKFCGINIEEQRFLPSIFPWNIPIQKNLNFGGKISEFLSIYCPEMCKNSWF